jgi:trehalose 6-phosphate phosphatase
LMPENHCSLTADSHPWSDMSVHHSEYFAPAPGISSDWAIFLDLDGTLLDIAPSPDGVKIPKTLCGDLTRARDVVGGALALVSGRSIETIDRLLSPLRLPIAGQHGAEIRYAPDEPILPLSHVDLDRARRLLVPVTAIPGVMIEDKGLSLAVHHRRARTPVGELHRWIIQTLGEFGDELEIMRGRRVFDIKPRGISKATAVERFMAKAPFMGRVPVFVGDDKTDEDGFKAVTARGGLAFQVGPNRSVLSSSRIENPASVRRWLRALPRTGAMAATDG